MKIIFQWKSRVRSESEKCNHCCEINLIFNLNYHIKISKQNHQTKRSRNWEGKRFYQLEISLTQLTFFRGTRGNLYPKKKRDSILLLFLPPHRRRNNEYPRRRRRKIPGFESSAVIDYLPCTRRIGFEKFFFPKRRKKYRGEKAPPTFDAFGNDDRSARKSEKVRKITTKRTRN